MLPPKITYLIIINRSGVNSWAFKYIMLSRLYEYQLMQIAYPKVDVSVDTGIYWTTK